MSIRLPLAALALLALGLGTAQPARSADGVQAAVEIREWTVPWENTRPRDPSVGRDGRVWFAGQQPNLLQGFDPRSGEFLPATPVPSGGITVRHSEYQAGENAIWFGTDANTIGRAQLPD